MAFPRRTAFEQDPELIRVRSLFHMRSRPSSALPRTGAGLPAQLAKRPGRGLVTLRPGLGLVVLVHQHVLAAAVGTVAEAVGRALRTRQSREPQSLTLAAPPPVHLAQAADLGLGAVVDEQVVVPAVGAGVGGAIGRAPRP